MSTVASLATGEVRRHTHLTVSLEYCALGLIRIERNAPGMIVNRLTVDGKDYFLPDPVDELRRRILEAVKSGGDYVNIPGLRGGPGLDILFSPGMPVTWVTMDIPDASASSEPEHAMAPGLDDLDF